MSTAPVTPALNKFETLMDHIGSGLEKFNNGLLNIAAEEAPVLEPLLPANISAGLAEFLTAALPQLAATDASLATINASTTEPWAARAAQATAVGGLGLLAILAKFGIVATTSQLPGILTAVGSIASTLKLTGITAPPVVTPVVVVPSTT